jgi:glycosyltransferase involved in cell wall biosynthesis
VVSTKVGAEGLAQTSGNVCLLSDDPEEFANHVLNLFDHPAYGKELAARARAEVQAQWDMPVITRKLLESYREVLSAKRNQSTNRNEDST